ncbi:hypothetical protein BXZ70DRAFT_17215 [Cristinia sonorae]|uniref:Uncharacterized protein n=1 Tax=Cristinia sonorae TaxID=1940300 RepID=A0A8K0XV09_9AGAR|nr:hypothetical protein BXZ70DRAFT_17215 [Cristinia sonorae]
MAESTLPIILELVLDYLSDILPTPILNIVETLFCHSWALANSLFTLVFSLITTPTSSWNAETILPPLITLLAAYLALISFYRTTGWMIRTAFAFVKWGFILTILGAAAGYIFANGANGAAGAGDGLRAFGGAFGIVPVIGGYLLDVLNGEGIGNNNANSRHRLSQTKKSKTKTQTKGKSQPRPKAWESWDRHRDWQYNANAQEERNPAAEIQRVVGEVFGAAGQAVRASGWWEAAKGVVNDFGERSERVRSGEGRAKSRRTSSR